MPEEGTRILSHNDIMRYEDILFLCRVLSSLGVRKVRFTGGEPFVRKDMISFLMTFRDSLENMAVSLTTNASLLPEYASSLAGIGLSSMNISLDTLDPIKFRKITRVGNVRDVLAGIASARSAGVENLKTNTVLMRGFNDAELPEILNFAWENELTPRLIEFMPLGDDVWKIEKFISADEILKTLGELYGGWTSLTRASRDSALPAGPAKYYVNSQKKIVGVIEAVSNHFCSTCNRLRITASGGLRSCLFARRETGLINLLRERDEEGLMKAILEGASEKPPNWPAERDGLQRMSRIGG
jgi:cyclic pyranopterin phosphate synthase